MSGAGAEVLGPVRLPGPDGRAVAVGGALARRLVVALALAGPVGRSADGLVDDVWGEEAPRSPRAALQMLVSRTRGAAAEGVLPSTATGYRLATSDLAQAEAAADGDLAGLDGALALWRGEPGADVDEPELAGALAQRAAAAQSRLLARRARLLLDAGRAQEALEDAMRLTALRPLESAPVLLRLEALGAQGRIAAALEAYAEHAALLAEALGADPDPAVVAAHARLLRAAPTAEAQLVGVRRGRDALLGRDADLAAIAAGLRASRLVTVLGPGGIGKTRIAHEAAAAAAARFGRIVFVELAGTRTADDVLAAVAQTAGARGARTRLANDPPAPDLAGRTVEALAAARTLLVLDNCEHVVDAAAALADDVLAAVPDLVVLATSRVPLLVPGELVHPLPPLPTDTDAAELFERRARAARPDVLLDPAAVRRVVAHLDGLPLAIELAAARLRAMSLAELEGRLADRFAVLVGGGRTAPERHRTLYAVIDWSWRLLPAPQQRAASLLGVFPDGFTADSAAAALGPAADGLLPALVDQSLLVFEEAPRPRYRMLETVREFAVAATDRDGLRPVALAALDAAALALARRLDPGLVGPVRGSVAELAAEEETFRAVLRADPGGRERVVVAIAAALAEYWIVRGEFESVADALPAALAAAGSVRGGDDRERAELVRVLVLAAVVAGISGATAAARTAALLRRAVRDLPAGTGGLWPAAAALVLQRTPPGPDSPAVRALEGSAEPVVATFGAVVRSQLLENTGRTAEALVDATRALRLAERHGLDWFGLLARGSLVQLHSQRGERQQALAAGEALEASAFAHETGADQRQQDWLMGITLLSVGRLDEAGARFDRLAALPVPSRAGEAEDVRAIAVAGLAELATAGGDEAGRVARWAEASTAARAASAPWSALVSAAATADAAARDDRGTALALYRRLRPRTLALIRIGGPRIDRPIVASAALALAAVLAGEPGSAGTAARLAAAALDGGARVDLPALERARAAFLPHEPGAGDPVERIRAVLESPAARR